MTPDEREVFDRQLVKWGFWIGWIIAMADAWYRWPLWARLAWWVLWLLALCAWVIWSTY